VFENGEYPRAAVLRYGDGIPSSKYEDIFRELESAFCSENHQQAAEHLLNDIFGRLQAVID